MANEPTNMVKMRIVRGVRVRPEDMTPELERIAAEDAAAAAADDDVHGPKARAPRNKARDLTA